MKRKEECLKQCHQDIDRIFRDILPEYGMAEREEQIKLCHEMLEVLFYNQIGLFQAGVGLGKTFAYLTACLVMQKNYIPNQYANLYRHKNQYIQKTQPIVISTPTIHLQNAIREEYLPLLFQALLEHGYLKKPIQSIIRKGKDHYICEIRLQKRIRAVREKQKNPTAGRHCFPCRSV